MPELPEVEVLVRHLAPLLRGRTIRGVEIRREKVIRPTSRQELRRALCGARFTAVKRRGKYLLFELHSRRYPKPIQLLGHLGMTGRMFVVSIPVKCLRSASPNSRSRLRAGRTAALELHTGLAQARRVVRR